MFLCTILVLLLLFYLFLINHYYQHWIKFKVPFEKPWILFGNMASFVFRQKSIAKWSQDMYNYSHNCRYVGFYSFFKPILLIKDLDLIKQLGIKDFDHFVDHRKMVCEELDPILSKNLFRLTGQKWRNMRHTVSPVFTSSKLRSAFLLISECAEHLTNYLSKKVDSIEPVQIEMKDIFNRFASDVIAATTFGIKCDSLAEKSNKFYVMASRICDFGSARVLKFFGYNISISLMKFLRINLIRSEIYHFFRNLVANNIKIREQNGIVQPDIINLLMKERERRNSNKNIKLCELTDDDVTAQTILFLIAGVDTTSSALCHMSHELAINIEIQEKLQLEIDQTLEETNGDISYDTISKLTYLDMVISEVLRKWPPVLVIDRVCVDSYVIQPENEDEIPVVLRKNDPIWFPIYAIHRNPQFYPDPDIFDPERFSMENKKYIQPLSYIPFGIGPRNCIGVRFAIMEIKILFFHILSKFSFVRIDKTQVHINQNKFQFILYAEDGYWLGLKLRNIHR